MENKLPSVSVIIPCMNEGRYIFNVLDRIASQSYTGSMEIIVVDALSEDDTNAIAERFSEDHPELPMKIITNQKRHIPVGLNMGIAIARGDIIVRMDGHSLPDKDYIQIAVDNLLHTSNDVVGGIWYTRPSSNTTIAGLIALALSHPFGVGDSRFRLPQRVRAQCVDTVPFGCFRKRLWEDLGGYDENLLINEDYDFNYRVRERGGRIFLNPEIKTVYFARDTLRKLVRQFYNYGKWKSKMLKKHPKSVKWRHLIPPLFVLFFILLGIGSLFSGLVLKIWLLQCLFYLLASLTATVHVLKTRSLSYRILMLPVVFLFMHFSWGFGVLRGAVFTLQEGLRSKHQKDES